MSYLEVFCNLEYTFALICVLLGVLFVWLLKDRKEIRGNGE